jgi:hypothetical protein
MMCHKGQGFEKRKKDDRHDQQGKKKKKKVHFCIVLVRKKSIESKDYKQTHSK